MSNADEQISGLERALGVSPGNVALRKLLAEALLAASYFERAEAEFVQALKDDPDDIACKFGLATAYHHQSKSKLALLVLEDVLGSGRAPGPAFVLNARLLIKTGRIEEAVEAYRRGIELDASAEDSELREVLGIDADPSASDVLDGRMRESIDEIFSDGGNFERPSISFEDIGGMEGVKQEVRLKIILPLTNRELYEQYGKTAGGGILLYGPPGCGKTHIARATAGEISGVFMAIGLHDVLTMWIGESEKQLHALFEQARQAQPSVLFFDEVDALAASRSDMRQSGGRHIISQFLSELDGVEDSNEGVLVLAATNAPWHLDSAFRRPGRFDRIIFVPPPDERARVAILRILLTGKPADAVDVDAVAKKTKEYSGADLKAVVDVAIEGKLEAAMKSGTVQPLTTRDLLKATKKQKSTTGEWFATARNHALFANEGGLYDDVLTYLGVRK